MADATVEGSSPDSFAAAAAEAFKQVPVDPNKEDYAEATVTKLSMTKGGIGNLPPEYRVELTYTQPASG